MQTKLQVEIDDFSFLEIPIEADNINFILHEVDRINSIVEQHYKDKAKEEGIKLKPDWRVVILIAVSMGSFFGIAVPLLMLRCFGR